MLVEVILATIAVATVIALALVVTAMALVVSRAMALVPGTRGPAAIRVAWMITLAIITALVMSREV